jgi:murein DD-endopeptidase MepM/ murein hydrolase activator NlpD
MFDAGDESGGFDTGPLADTVFTELSVALSRAGGVGLGQSMLAPLMTAQTKIPGIGIPGIGTPGIFRTTSSFGWRDDPIRGGLTFHKGVDLAMPVGQEVPSARPGEVVSAGELPGYGQTVVVRHSDRTSTRYAHLSEILVKPGEIVAAGQTIARSGATGRVTGPHLHFEVVQDGTPVDPEGGW